LQQYGRKLVAVGTNGIIRGPPTTVNPAPRRNNAGIHSAITRTTGAATANEQTDTTPQSRDTAAEHPGTTRPANKTPGKAHEKRKDDGRAFFRHGGEFLCISLHEP
jgi:hypothetical protein